VTRVGLRAQGQASTPERLCADCPDRLEAVQKCAGAVEAVQAFLGLDGLPRQESRAAPILDQSTSKDTAEEKSGVTLGPLVYAWTFASRVENCDLFRQTVALRL
jgi:hypothetical protein